MKLLLNSERLSSPFVREVECVMGHSAWKSYQCGNCTAGHPSNVGELAGFNRKQICAKINLS